MLDHIIVETGGVKMNLNRMALVTIIDPKTLSITPYDPEVTIPSKCKVHYDYISYTTSMHLSFRLLLLLQAAF